MKNKTVCLSLPEDLVLALKKYSGELIHKTGETHSISSLIQEAVLKHYSHLTTSKDIK